MMASQAFPIIGTLIAEYLAKFIYRSMITHEAIPIIMRNFVTEVSKKGAIWLLECAALLFTFGVIRFGKIDRDHAIQMPRKHRFIGGGEKVEYKSRRILSFVAKGKV
jgi:hypothetical protein